MCRDTQLQSKNPANTIVFHTLFDSLKNRGSQEISGNHKNQRHQRSIGIHSRVIRGALN